MSQSSQHVFTNSPPSCSSRFTSYHSATNLIKNPNNLALPPPVTSRHLLIHISHNDYTPFKFIPNSKFYHSLKPNNCSNTSVVTTQTHDNFNLDSLLSISEVVCLFSSSVIAIGFAVYYGIFGLKNSLFGLIGRRVLACGVVSLVCGVWIGAVIRRRQWRRVCGETVRAEGRESVNLVGRIEKLEEDMKSSATILRVLSRQLEKLGVRFRVTRKTLKDPITQAAALAQKNSEATKALAMQEDVLEKELGEIQKVLLAMQEQQQKQLELILAIGKTGKLFENRQEPSQEQDKLKTSDFIDGAKQMETQETEALGSSRGNKNDRA
ncbi:hypothetical protein AB3S75_001695 [Citrus x aurantiifolia]